MHSLLGLATDDNLWYHGVGVGTLPSAQLLVGPGLTALWADHQLTLAWPLAAGFTLSSKANLTGATWNPVTNTPSATGGSNSVVLPATGSAQFFRLQSP